MHHVYKIRILNREKALLPRKPDYHFQRVFPLRPAQGGVTPGAIVLEGGAFRGLYTSGVCDTLMDNGINMACAVGVSAGALNSVNYVAGVAGRSAITNLNHRHDSRYVGLRALRESRGLIGFDFLFGDLAHRYPIPEEKPDSPRRRLVAVATDCETGTPAFLEKSNCSDMDRAITASASMPLASRVVTLDGRAYLDGGCSRNIPVDWALEDGYRKIIVVLTRDRTFQRKNGESVVLEKAEDALYRKYPALLQALRNTAARYNGERERVFQLEQAGQIFVIAPSEPVNISRLEGNLDKLVELYDRGYADALAQLAPLRAYLDK